MVSKFKFSEIKIGVVTCLEVFCSIDFMSKFGEDPTEKKKGSVNENQ